MVPGVDKWISQQNATYPRAGVKAKLFTYQHPVPSPPYQHPVPSPLINTRFHRPFHRPRFHRPKLTSFLSNTAHM
jgi:hypothetical protein